MVIDISAKLIYGLPYSDLPEEILDEVNEMLEDGELEYASPYYDAPRDEWIVGVEVDCWNKGLVDLLIEADNMKWDVPKIIRDFDLDFYVTPHVS